MKQKRTDFELQLEQSIDRYIRENSKLDLKRPYVGLSNIGKCELYIYNTFMQGTQMTEDSYRSSYRGYLLEADMRAMLLDLGFLKEGKPPEITVPVHLTSGVEVKGHLDDVAYNGAGVELKSCSREKFDKLQSEQRIFLSWFSQAQAYMKYGGYNYFYFVIRCTETTRHYVHTVIPLMNVQLGIERKIKIVCQAIASHQKPECKCGHCNGHH